MGEPENEPQEFNWPGDRPDGCSVLFFAGRGASARTPLRATEIPPAQQASQSIERFWQGALDASVFKLRLLMNFSRTPDGKLKGLLDRLDQGVNDIPMDIVSFQDGSLHLEIKSIRASYDGKLSTDGKQLIGEFTQGRASVTSAVLSSPSFALGYSAAVAVAIWRQSRASDNKR